MLGLQARPVWYLVHGSWTSQHRWVPHSNPHPGAGGHGHDKKMVSPLTRLLTQSARSPCRSHGLRAQSHSTAPTLEQGVHVSVRLSPSSGDCSVSELCGRKWGEDQSTALPACSQVLHSLHLVLRALGVQKPAPPRKQTAAVSPPDAQWYLAVLSAPGRSSMQERVSFIPVDQGLLKPL